MKDCKVAIAQIKVSNPKTNTKKIINYIKRASKKDADIVLFPETCIYVYPKSNPKDFNGFLEMIKEACKENEIWCIFTSYNLRRGKKYNTAFLINRDGRVIYTYDKIHLYGDEKKYIAPGRSNRVIDTEFGKIGIIICLDMAFPEESRKLAEAWLIFCPTFESDWEDDSVPRALPLVRAYENVCYFVVCDAFNKNTVSISSIASPRRILKSITKKEGLIIQNLKYTNIKKLRDSEESY